MKCSLCFYEDYCLVTTCYSPQCCERTHDKVMRKRVYFGYWFQWMPGHSGREDMALGGGGRWFHHRQQETVRMDLEVRVTFYYLSQYPKVSTSSQKSITTSGQNIQSLELGASVRCKPKQTLSRDNCQHFKILPS